MKTHVGSGLKARNVEDAKEVSGPIPGYGNNTSLPACQKLNLAAAHSSNWPLGEQYFGFVRESWKYSEAHFDLIG